MSDHEFPPTIVGYKIHHFVTTGDGQSPETFCPMDTPKISWPTTRTVIWAEDEDDDKCDVCGIDLADLKPGTVSPV